MRIIDINPDNERPYFCCLEEWSEDIKEAGDHKEKWYNQMKDKGLKVKFAQDDNGTIGGMIQYLPIEYSMFEGKGLYVVLCIWVHGHKQGRGDFRHKGMGKALIQAAEQDCRELGADGLVTWGLIIPTFMRASWFKRQGYKVVDKNGLMRLLWKPFHEQAIPPKFIRPLKTPIKGTDKVNVSVFRNGWCPAMNMTYERTKRAIKDFEGKIEFLEYDTTNREVMKEWGFTDALFIDGKEVRTGPPPSYKKIRNKIERRARKK